MVSVLGFQPWGYEAALNGGSQVCSPLRPGVLYNTTAWMVNTFPSLDLHGEDRPPITTRGSTIS